MQNLLRIDIDRQLSIIVDFLKATHPFLEKKGQYACIELRAISREKYEYKLAKPFVLWNLNEKSVEKLRSWLEIHREKPYCLYYSVYCFDYNKISYTKKGTPAQKGRITNSSAVFTEEVTLDFDNIDYNQFKEIYSKLDDIGINGMWLFTGHGYQFHLFLDKPLFDKKGLYKIVYKFRSKGFDADENCTDPARVMRLPHTYNCKCFNDKKYKDEKPLLCDIVSDNRTKYSFEDISAALDKLPTVSKQDAVLEQEIQTIETNPEDNIVITKIEYPWLQRFELPEQICKMLNEVNHGYRNRVLGFLVRYFKTYLKLSRWQIKEILSLWSIKACKPAYNSEEFEYDFQRFYYRNGLNYDSILSKKFGYINFSNQIEIKKKNIYIPANFINSFSKLSSKEVRLYLAIKILEHKEKNTTAKDIANVLELTERATFTIIRKLLKTNFIYKIEGYKKKGIPNQYVVSKIVSNSTGGNLMISYNDAMTYIKELGKGEIKLYLFMLSKFYSGNCFMSQTNLSENIGVQQSWVSRIIKTLKEKEFIEIEKIPLSNFLYYCQYTLLL